MAEFCLECLNEAEEKKLKRADVVLSREWELCEGCGRLKRTVIKYSRYYLLKEGVAHLRAARRADGGLSPAAAEENSPSAGGSSAQRKNKKPPLLYGSGGFLLCFLPPSPPLFEQNKRNCRKHLTGFVHRALLRNVLKTIIIIAL